MWFSDFVLLLSYVFVDVTYSLFEGDAHLDSVISFNSHHTLHRRQSGNDNTTSSPTPTGGTTPEFTEQEVGKNHYVVTTTLSGRSKFGVKVDNDIIRSVYIMLNATCSGR